ncbi:MAG: prepilin-type N-terminal cleavage/methylation domain-containing protein [Gemmatimonadota bacterium]|nr:prepilin-type N-terminal cleavage/methylation domain-containing protein [Gemmatimonadota bacterium]
MKVDRGVSRRAALAREGFTLIEVIGAFVIFSVGVLMVVRLSTATGTQMRYAGIRSELAVRAAERLDSLDAQPSASLTMGADADTLTIMGLAYERSVTLTRVTPLLARVEIEITPVGGDGPTFRTTSYVAEAW